MASIFTFDPDPPRISSPWSTPGRSTPTRTEAGDAPSSLPDSHRGIGTPPPALLADCGITRLEAEPQEGPTEYKLHLLLRKRRSLTSSTTGQRVGGSSQSRTHVETAHVAKPSLGPSPGATTAPSAGFSQSRQNRLQQLTTQLLWRLQQSSPNHSSSLGNLVVPTFPELANTGDKHTRPGRLLPGLEESHGALYEIGVSDDGTFVGLTEDEMDESLNNLRAMAASLGCNVHILRMVVVGSCQWTETASSSEDEPGAIRNDRLWVAEALVRPDLEGISRRTSTTQAERASRTLQDRHAAENLEEQSPTEQLRISLTGTTTSGKSSLLGTLSTATLDSGRGKSRLSLLRHRHELVSGVTSSVAQELLGYSANTADTGDAAAVVNFASGNVSSWMDIHAACESGRLVFFSDSAGHPRYRRTTVRGLVGWAPHWTILCIAADQADDEHGRGDTETSSSSIDRSSAEAGSTAHLELCLRLGVPLIVVFTKLDRATKTGLRQILTPTLTLLKAAGRKPVILSASARGSEAGQDPDLQSISPKDQQIAGEALEAVRRDGHGTVIPIVLTSAVTGMGIGTMHALLRTLPIPRVVGPARELKSAKVVFHIEDIFGLPESAVISTREQTLEPDAYRGAIVSGYLRYGEISIGDELLLGPVPSSRTEEGRESFLNGSGSPIRKFDQTNRRRSSTAFELDVASSEDPSTWRKVRVVSVRNLRLPVRRMLAGQVGTIGFIQQPPNTSTVKPRTSHLPGAVTNGIPGLRKGLILTSGWPDLPPSHTGFTGVFDGDDLALVVSGSLVVVYIASVRAVARVVSVHEHSDGVNSTDGDEQTAGLFSFDDHEDIRQRPRPKSDVRFHFATTREWIEVGTQVLVMPAGAAAASHGLPASTRSGRDSFNKASGGGLLDACVGVITSVYCE